MARDTSKVSSSPLVYAVYPVPVEHSNVNGVPRPLVPLIDPSMFIGVDLLFYSASNHMAWNVEQGYSGLEWYS